MAVGMDLNCGDTASNFTVEAVHSGLLNTSDIDKALHNSFTVLYRLGYFDGDPLNDPKYGKLDHSNICSPEHQDLALEAALQGIVLLKNDQNTLPLSADKIRSLAVLGPNANDTVNTMLGNYAGEYSSPTRSAVLALHIHPYLQVTAENSQCVSFASFAALKL